METMTTQISIKHAMLDDDPVVVVTAIAKDSEDMEGGMILHPYEDGYIEGVGYNQSETRWEKRIRFGNHFTVAWGLTLEALAREVPDFCHTTIDDAAEALRKDVEGIHYLGYARPRHAFGG